MPARDGEPRPINPPRERAATCAECGATRWSGSEPHDSRCSQTPRKHAHREAVIVEDDRCIMLRRPGGDE